MIHNLRSTFLILVSLLLSSILYHLTSNTTHAESLLSPSYRIRFGNFNITSGLKTSASYSLTDTVGQSAAELFTSSGYSVRAGFQYIYTIYDFRFVISDLSIDLGALITGNFATDSNTLSVDAPGQGYSIQTIASGRLESENGDFIPDTSCNSGCTQSTAGVWNSGTAYGFGYNASGSDVESDFVDNTYFRPFPDLSLGDTPATIASTTASGRGRVTTITYSLNVPPGQEAGDYQTLISYIATPVY